MEQKPKYRCKDCGWMKKAITPRMVLCRFKDLEVWEDSQACDEFDEYGPF